MNYAWRIGTIPDGLPRLTTTVQLRRISDGSTITPLLSDSDGWIAWERAGHLEEDYLYVTGVPGGDTYRDSRVAKTAGVMALRDLPAVLSVLGDGVIRGSGNDLALSLVGGGLTAIAVRERPPLAVLPGLGPVVTLAGSAR